MRRMTVRRAGAAALAALAAGGLAAPAPAGFEIILPSAPAADPPAAPRAAGKPAPRVRAAPMRAPSPPDGHDCFAEVRAGDTLARFAAREADGADGWREIAKLNRIADPDCIAAGWKLAVPCAAATSRKAVAAAEEALNGGGPAETGTAAETPETAGAAASAPSGTEAADGTGTSWPAEPPQSSAERNDPAVPLRLRDPEPAPAMEQETDGGGQARETAEAAPDEPAEQTAAGGGEEPRMEASSAGDGAEEAAASAARETAAAEPSPRPPCHAFVRAGDTLSALAARDLGDGSRWPEIAALNGLSDPDRIFAGQMLALPCGPGAPAPAPKITLTAEREDAPPPPPAEDAEDEPPTGAVWRADAGEMLDDAISRWALEAGWTPLISERWFWRFETDFSMQGGFEDAIREVLLGFPREGTAPGVVIHANDVIELVYR